jgi:hypothetical protein
VVVWSQAATTGDPEQLRRLFAVRPRPVMIAAAGPGWARDGLPLSIERPADLTEALALTIPVASGI